METVSGVGVIDKAMLVLRSVADGPQSLGDLQASTGLPRATAHRLAGALEDHGLLRRDGAGRFEFGHDLADLGRIAAARFPLVGAARPLLGALRDDTGESVQLFVASGDQRRCVLSLETPHGLRWIVPEGSLFPLGLGSAGRVLSGETLTAGWIESIGEREPGVASVSAPVIGADGTIVGAVSVSGPIERMSQQPGKRFGDAVIAAAAELSRALGG
jgi:DNA-binding IclR family transcriptional regulator